jgi:flagellar hook-length control protein FliK
MDDLNVRNRNTVASATNATKSGSKAQNTSGPQFASFLVFGTNDMNTNLSTSADQSENDTVYDQGDDAGYNQSYHDDRDVDHADRRDDEPIRESRNGRDDSRDENVRDSAPDDQHKDSTAQNNDDKGHQEEKPRDQNASNDNQGHDDSNVSDNTQTNTDAQSQNTDGAQTTETNAASGDKVTDEAATNALAQSTAAAAQTATDPAIVAMADPKKGTLVDQTVKTTTQGTQAVDANGTNNKDLFSQGWQSGGNQNKAGQNQQAQAQTPQQNQNANTNQQATNADMVGQTNTEAQKQAADLSKKLGAGQRVNVNVNVTEKSADMTSVPTQNLSNATQTATDASAAVAAAKQQGAQKGTGTNQGPTPQVIAANTQVQNTQQNTTQNTQNQSFQTTVGDASNASGAAKGAAAQQPQAIDTQNVQANTTNNAQNTQQSQQAAQTKQPLHQKPAVHTTAKVEDISVEISKAAKAGNDRINIQLKPLDLGRIEVQLDMSSGKVVTTVIADRADTLNMLKNDASQLSKALSDAGLQMGDMSFNLKQQDNSGQQAGGTGNGGGNDGLTGNTEPEEEIMLASQMDMLSQRAKDRAAIGGVDISA